MRLTSILARRHLEQYGDGTDPQLQYRTLERLLQDVYLAGSGSSCNKGQEASTGEPCAVFSPLGLLELRCARCGAPAWRHTQPVTFSAALDRFPSERGDPDFEAIDGALDRTSRP